MLTEFGICCFTYVGDRHLFSQMLRVVDESSKLITRKLLLRWRSRNHPLSNSNGIEDSLK